MVLCTLLYMIHYEMIPCNRRFNYQWFCFDRIWCWNLMFENKEEEDITKLSLMPWGLDTFLLKQSISSDVQLTGKKQLSWPLFQTLAVTKSEPSWPISSSSKQKDVHNQAKIQNNQQKTSSIHQFVWYNFENLQNNTYF